jgi:hypothetical protein
MARQSGYAAIAMRETLALSQMLKGVWKFKSAIWIRP